MNVFNRIVMFLLSLATLAFGVISLLLLGGVIRPVAVSPGGVLMSQWSFFTRLSTGDATSAAIVSVIVALVGLIVLILELIPGRREPAHYVIRQDGLGKVTVARTSVRDLVQHEAATVPGIMETRQEVDGGPKGLHIHVRTALAPDAEASAVGEALQVKIQQSVQHHIGVPVSAVDVATQIAPLDNRTRRRVR